MSENVCIICKSTNDEPLRCPAKSFDKDAGLKAYSAFLENVFQFKELDASPVNVKFSPETSAEYLFNKQACWHKSCHLKFSNTKLERVRRGKRKLGACSQEGSSRKKREVLSKEVCIFCDQEDGELHEVMTVELDARIRRMAEDLEDSKLFKRLTGGDMIAIEAKYHKKCMTSFNNRHRAFLRKSVTSVFGDEEKKNEARAFAELISYINTSVQEEKYLFPLTELHTLYINRLHDFGITKSINKTRLKARLISQFLGEIQEQTNGKNTLLVFNQGMMSIMKERLKKLDYESDALILTKAADIVRRELFQMNGFHFDGNFPENCQANSVPTSLKTLVSMLLYGANISTQDNNETQATLTLSQLIVFNAKKNRKKSTRAKRRHSLKREPPLPLYLGLNIHALTRSKKIITQLYELGLSISYDRVDELANSLASAVCKRFQEDRVVCPLNLRHGIFTVGAIDNLDHNPSSTTAHGSFHGTGISLFQFPSNTNPGISRTPITLPDKPCRDIVLPENYATVPAVAVNAKNAELPDTPYNVIPLGNLTSALSQEQCWAQHAVGLLNKELSTGDVLSWASYHASCDNSQNAIPVLSGLLPLFFKKASSLAMVKHGMEVQAKATQYLNPAQIPITAFDQPLFVLAKCVQWKWPEIHGEGKHIVMMGGLHLEMALWNVVGDLLEASGWTNALAEAGIATSGTAESCLKSAHLTRTRHAHQVTALSLHNLQHQAFLESQGSENFAEEEYKKWTRTMKAKNATFHFWDLILNLELTILVFVRAHRERNFSLYVETLENLVTWFFALDHTNYARWVPVHIKDMKSLPSAIKEDLTANWVITKSHHSFSSIPIDQAHEQNNAIVKGSGGAIGLTENPTAFHRWMVCGPEFARLLREFEGQIKEENHTARASEPMAHHEHGASTQKTFQSQVNGLSNAISNLGNPFNGGYSELINIATGDCAADEVVQALKTIKDLGSSQYTNYVKVVIDDRTASIHDSIKKNALPLFKRQTPKPKSKLNEKMKSLKSDCHLFSRLYIATQHRSGDLIEFFSHENQPYPPSLSEFGRLRSGTKSDLLTCLSTTSEHPTPQVFHCKVFDGAAIVHALPVAGVATFNSYADNVFIPYLIAQLQSADQIDVVWDRYKHQSIKEAARQRRGTGYRRKVSAETKIPTNWKSFLQNSSNKVELFEFLTSKVSNCHIPDGKKIILTSGEGVVSANGGTDMRKCDHEEADTRIVVHVLDALQKGASRVLVRTVDTDVVVILIGLFNEMSTLSPSTDLWIAFGMGKNLRYLSVNSVCASLGPETSMALPIFHAFTGCDTTSFFYGKGKKSAWMAWKSYPKVTESFLMIRNNPYQVLGVNDSCFKELERYTVVLYDKSSTAYCMNEARQELFTKKDRSLDNIPPTKDALLQHTLRSIYQSSIWVTSSEPQQSVPLPEGWGWKIDDDSWKPMWTTIPEAAKACTELLKCSCKKGCNSRCTCVKANLPCTSLCQCTDDTCNNRG